jgi:ankyrin repeat protein
MKGPGGDTPLMYAALYGNAPAVQALLAAGADPRAANRAGATALMWGVADAGITGLLLDHGADANAATPLRVTALSLAAGRQDGEAVTRLLLARGAKPTPQVLVSAAAAGSEGMFKLLVASGADPRGVPPLGLLQAVRTGCRACIEALSANADANALALALVGGAPFGDAAAMKILLERGGKTDATVVFRPDLTGRTPLMMAANSDAPTAAAVRLLLARGADANFKGPDGETALELARHGRTPVVELLEQAGARASQAYPSPRFAPAPASTPREAVARVLPLLQSADVRFIQKTGCVSCHHNTLTTLTLAAARPRGIAFDEAIQRWQVSTVAAKLEADRQTTLLNGQVTNTAAWVLVGLAAGGHPGDPATDAAVYSLLARQLPSGRWRNFTFDHRPPLQSSDIDVTAAAVRAISAYPIPAYADACRRSVRQAEAWLRSARPRTTAEASMRLLGLHWAGVRASDPAMRSGARELLRSQRPDGGWADLPSLDSDAYVTGQALVALAQAAGLTPTDPAFRRGVEYLRTSQQADGTWYVKTRSIPFQPFFESGFPYGRDQWISAAATNWAAQALLVAVR